MRAALQGRTLPRTWGEVVISWLTLALGRR